MKITGKMKKVLLWVYFGAVDIFIKLLVWDKSFIQSFWGDPGQDNIFQYGVIAGQKNTSRQGSHFIDCIWFSKAMLKLLKLYHRVFIKMLFKLHYQINVNTGNFGNKVRNILILFYINLNINWLFRHL